jgi:hypothetical protein
MRLLKTCFISSIQQSKNDDLKFTKKVSIVSSLFEKYDISLNSIPKAKSFVYSQDFVDLREETDESFQFLRDSGSEINEKVA